MVPSATYSGGRPQRPSRRPFSRRETTSEEDIDPASQRLPPQPPVGTQVPQLEGPQIDTVAQQPLQQAIRRSILTPGHVIVSILFIIHCHRIILNASLASQICMTERQQHRLPLEVPATENHTLGISLLVQTKGVK